MHRRYNPEGISQYNIVPGLLGVILQMTMVMMTSMALTRETERGTMENLLAMPATPGRDHARQDPALSRRRRRAGGGGAGRRASCCSRVPFVGLAVAAARRRSSSSCWRWCCSATRSRRVARTQMQAMQLTFFFFLPSILLSGFMFPYRGMPGWAQVLRRDLPADAFPARHPRGDAEGRRPRRRSRARCCVARRSSSRPSPPWRCSASGARWTDGEAGGRAARSLDTHAAPGERFPTTPASGFREGHDRHPTRRLHPRLAGPRPRRR